MNKRTRHLRKILLCIVYVVFYSTLAVSGRMLYISFCIISKQYSALGSCDFDIGSVVVCAETVWNYFSSASLPWALLCFSSFYNYNCTLQFWNKAGVIAYNFSSAYNFDNTSVCGWKLKLHSCWLWEPGTTAKECTLL